MKLLIVDDEELTRTGVISSLDWSSLGIDEVIQADDGVHGLETARPSMADFCQDFLDFLAPLRTKCIYLEKKMQYLVYFLFSQEAPSSHQIHAAGEYLCSHFEKYGRYTIAVGDTVYGLPKAYQTYTSAVILLQSGYFFPENSLLTSESLENIPDVQINVFADTPAGSFADILSRQDADGAKKFLDMLHQNFFKITVFCRIRSNTCITNFFSVWKMHVISKKLQVPVMWKALLKQLTTVSLSLNCIRHSWIKLLSFSARQNLPHRKIQPSF